jgi:hypothetical protein
MYDEVENMKISVNVPGDLTMYLTVALKCKTLKDGTKTYNWYVSNPINNYGVNINIGDYVTFSENTKAKRHFRLYVLCSQNNLAKAKTFSRCTKDAESF